MQENPSNNNPQDFSDYRLEFIQELIIQLASGNLNYRGLVSEKGDDFDAIITGINMLGEELQTSTVDRDYLNSIVEGIMDMIIILDPNLKIEKVNESLQQTLGFDDYSLKGKTLNELLKLSKKEFSTLLHSISSHAKIKSFETSFFSASKIEIPVSLNISKIYGKSGEERGILITAKDISELKKIQQDLSKSNNELNTFVYKLSHDLRGPISSILGLTDLSTKELTGSVSNEKWELAKEYIQLIQQSSFKLDNIIKNLSEVISLRRQTVIIRDFKIAPIINEIIDKKIPKTSTFEVVKRYDDSHFFCGDKRHLQLIFMHLIDNAFRYRKKNFIGAQCEVVISNLKNFLLIKVIDNGKGISAEHIDYVFEMFHRASADSTGSGLGLFIIKSIVDKLNGEIQIFSQIGKGTEILIFLPIQNGN